MRVEQIPGNRYGILSHASAMKDEGGEKRKKLRYMLLGIVSHCVVMVR
jgi:hypothetical protein